ARATSENGLRDIRADSPCRRLRIEQFGDVRGIPTTLPEQNQRRIICSFGDSDLRVGDGHLTLRLRNVWAALEKIGRKRSIDVGRLGRKCARRKMEIGSGLADQHSDSILKLFALLLQEDCLSLRGVEKSFLLSYVQARGNSTIVAGIYQVQTFLQCVD